jgi:hypothetical protein
VISRNPFTKFVVERSVDHDSRILNYMRRLIIIGSMLAIACASLGISARVREAPRNAAKGVTYGAGVTAGERLGLDAAMKSKSFGKTIRVIGSVEEVCKVKGCWMMLSDGKSRVRVTFKDYGFFMPKNLVGYKVALEGVLTEETLTEKDARHYAEDAGKSAKEIAAIVGDQKEYSFEATGVVVL